MGEKMYCIFVLLSENFYHYYSQREVFHHPFMHVSLSSFSVSRVSVRRGLLSWYMTTPIRSGFRLVDPQALVESTSITTLATTPSE